MHEVPTTQDISETLESILVEQGTNNHSSHHQVHYHESAVNPRGTVGGQNTKYVRKSNSLVSCSLSPDGETKEDHHPAGSTTHYDTVCICVPKTLSSRVLCLECCT